MRYPTSCLSAYCGNIVCDDCPNRDRLKAWYVSQGKDFEAQQAKSRQTMASIEAKAQQDCTDYHCAGDCGLPGSGYQHH